MSRSVQLIGLLAAIGVLAPTWQRPGALTWGVAFAQHEGHGEGQQQDQGEGASKGAGEHAGMPAMKGMEGREGAETMPGMPKSKPTRRWFVLAAIGLFVLVALVLSSRRGMRLSPHKLLNRQTIGGVLILVVVLLATRHVVKKYRKPGAMTVVEAQAMDMSVMKPPVGATPVVTEVAQRGAFEAKVTYTGTVVAFNDEDIYPRVTGWIRSMPVYPGDHVHPGQLVARLDSAELGSRANEAAFAQLGAEQARAQMEAEEAQARAMKVEAEAEKTFAHGGLEEAERELVAARSMVTETQRNLAATKAMAKQTEKELARAQSALRGSRSELEAAQEAKALADANVFSAQAEVSNMEAELTSAQGHLAHWQAQAKRTENLYKKGAASLEEWQKDEADAKTAQADVTGAEAKIRGAKSAVRNAEAAARQAEAMVRVAEAKVEETQNDVDANAAKVEQARANVEAMAAKVEQTKASTEAVQARLTQTRAMLRKSEASVRNASAGINAAARKKESAGAAALQMGAAATTASVIKGYTEIRSSVEGVVTQRLVSPGVLASPGAPILKIAQIGRVRLQANVAEQDAAGVHVGNAVRVHTMKDPRRITETKVSSVFPAADPTARTVIVEALTPNPDQHLLPGQYVVMEIATQHTEDSVTVPTSALVEVTPEKTGVFYTEKQHAVWVVLTRKSTGKMEYYCTMHPEVVRDRPGNCPKCGMKLEPRTKSGNQYAHLVHVTTGFTDGRRTVIASGLNGGEEVVVAGHRDLREGDAVKPRSPLAFPAQGGGAPAGQEETAGTEMPTPQGHKGHEGLMPSSSALGGAASSATSKTVYTCPMHPEITSDKPGRCPQCGMQLERKSAREE